MKLTTKQSDLLAQLNRLRRQHPNPEAPVQEKMEFIADKCRRMNELIEAIAEEIKYDKAENMYALA